MYHHDSWFKIKLLKCEINFKNKTFPCKIYKSIKTIIGIHNVYFLLFIPANEVYRLPLK